MDELIISNFDTAYYNRAIGGAVVFVVLTGRMLYACLLGNPAPPMAAYIITLLLCGVLWVYYYFFSRSWKRITVTATEIIVYDVVFKKQVIIPYAEITRMGTYRTRKGFSQNFAIEFKDDQSVAFNEAWYDNYNKLTMAIYNHKYGPGHARERYLERRGDKT
ncbi:hypothetical protein [Mucilaginibacter sp. OK098]|uniref:hypothetical protein n=1 Tax=Mucilaginibacter sp. OK098 TaxID=1855297 RepID=UPI000913C761|nr:hypothetical protein [Mucilaginibacter sp. OK098]SHN30502.1 hypothetical protein SAMN05216524_10941 [Mucilaginibacter sp. OK098]